MDTVYPKKEAPATPEGVTGRRERDAEPVRPDSAVKIAVVAFPACGVRLDGDREQRAAVGAVNFAADESERSERHECPVSLIAVHLALPENPEAIGEMIIPPIFMCRHPRRRGFRATN